MSDIYTPSKYDISGFDLFAKEDLDGSLLIGFGPNSEMTRVESFPEKVALNGQVYNFEGCTFNREKFNITDKNHPGYYIVHGHYA